MTGPYFVYILRCAGDVLYTGVTTDFSRRLREHRAGTASHGARFTAAHRPENFAALWLAPDRSSAQKLEYAIKRLSRSKKLTLIEKNEGLDLSPYFRITLNDKGEPLMTFICYPKCSTCKKAQAWLEEKGIAFSVRDIKAQNPTKDELRSLWEMSGLPLRKFFNTSGMLYREMGLASKLDEMSDDEKLTLLATDGMLVKRPILVGADFALVGFREKEWAEKLP